jgi:hypothetical protein
MKKKLHLFSDHTQEIKKNFFITVFFFTSSLVLGQTIPPTKTVIVNACLCGTIDAIAANETKTVQCLSLAIAPTVPTATDNYGNILTPSNPVISNSLSFERDLTYTYTFTDCVGNKHDWIYTYIIDDTIPPTATTPKDIRGLQCMIDIPVANILDVTDESDNCSGIVKVSVIDTNNEASGCKGSPYIVTRTYTLTDCSGNSTDLVQTITIEDDTVPTFTAPANTEIFTTASCTYDVSVEFTGDVTNEADNCSTDLNATYTDTMIAGTCEGSKIITRTWCLIDKCGNKAQDQVQTITVSDKMAPTWTTEFASLNTTVECSNIEALETAQAKFPIAADNCDSDVTNISKTAGQFISNEGCANSGSYTNTWTVTDACGNQSAVFTQVITIQDKTGPTTTTLFATNINVNCDAIPIKPELVFLDNCSTVTDPIYTVDISNRTLNNYTITRNWSVTDVCGNTSKFIQIINVHIQNGGTIAPQIITACNADSSPIDIAIKLPAGSPLNGIWINTDNIGKLDGNIFNAFDVPLGDYTFEYRVPNKEDCATSIQVKLTVNNECKVLGCKDIEVHNLVSPNWDGLNDKLVIDGAGDIDCYASGVAVEIYNRWGILVFETSKYNNETNAFDGHSSGRTTIKESAGLPAGTYFYMVSYESKDGNGNIQTNKKDGFIYLAR